MDLEKYIPLYLSEGREHLSSLTNGLKSEKGFDKELISILFRSAHSLKGMAASMGFETTSKLAHSLENLLSGWREKEFVEKNDVDMALRATDILESLFQSVEKTGSDSGFEKEVDEWVEQTTKECVQNNIQKEKIEVKKEEIQKAELKKIKLKVEIDSSSSLPAARLLVVLQKIKLLEKDVEIIPKIEEIKEKGLKSAEFFLPENCDIDSIGKSINSLPEVANVTIEKMEERQGSEPSLVSFLKVPAQSIDEFLFRISHLIYHLNTLEKSLSLEEKRKQKFWLESHRSLLHQLYNEVLETRLVSFDTLIERLERSLRDVSYKTQKKIEFLVEGKGEKIDKVILEKLVDPLNHLLRNACDHGIEHPEERKKIGKSESGKVMLSIKREGEKLTISLSDDGKGLDYEAIMENALKRGLITPEKARNLTEKDYLDLITIPSFSTKKEVSTISGRGVGLDVVKASVESIGGSLEMFSKKGEGTTFSLVFPSAVTLIEVIVFCWNREYPFAIPTSQVKKLYPLREYPIEWVEGKKKLKVQENFLEILNFRLSPVGKDGTGIGINFLDGERVMLVNEVIKTEKVVVLPLGKPLERIGCLIGGALLSSGDIVYILDGFSFSKKELEAINVFQTQ